MPANHTREYAHKPQVLRCADGVSQPAVSSTLSLSFRLQDLAASDAGRCDLPLTLEDVFVGSHC
eukprot:2901434-Pleurochrysis_carterae.AAC.2